MDPSCDLEVDVNGQQVFFVNKKTISTFSGKLRKFMDKSTGVKRLKIIYRDFPGGPESFELFAKFCYNNGRIQITLRNVGFLYNIAHYMEMSRTESISSNLLEQSEEFIDKNSFSSCSEVLDVLKCCRDSFPIEISSKFLRKCLDSIVTKIVSTSDSSPSCSSPDRSNFRLSFGTRITESPKANGQRLWWIEDLVFLNSDNVKTMILSMVSRKFDHGKIFKFLLFYLKSKISNISSSEKPKFTENIIDILFTLDRSSLSCKGLFEILRIVSGMNIRKKCRMKLEAMIGCQLDRAVLDNLLCPSPPGMNFLYDVDLVLRLIKYFLSIESSPSLTRLRIVGILMDMYLAEIAPDFCLKPSKFYTMLKILPDSARISNDGIYRAMDMYFQVHTGLSEEEKMKITSSLNYDKLSLDVCKHLAKNPRFPSRTVIQALIHHHYKLKTLIQDTKTFKSFKTSPCHPIEENCDKEKINHQNHGIILRAQNLDLSTENKNLRNGIQGMQWRVIELERDSNKMQTQLTKLKKTRLSSLGNGRSLPKLCS